MRCAFCVLILAAVLLVADARAAGRALKGCKKQDCDGYKKKHSCYAAEWRDSECECACTDHGWASKVHDCGRWRCKDYEDECRKVYMDFKDCVCLCVGELKTPVSYAGAWHPGQGGAGGHGGGYGGGRGGHGGRGGSGRGGYGGRGGGRGGGGGGGGAGGSYGQPGAPGAPGRR